MFTVKVSKVVGSSWIIVRVSDGVVKVIYSY